MQLLGILHGLLSRNQLGGEGLCCVLVLHGLIFIALGTGLISQFQSLASIALQLFYLCQTAVKLHFQLTLVTNHGGRLLRQLLVLALSIFNSLLDLHLRIGVFLDLIIEESHQVLPALNKWVRHGVLQPF